MCGPAFDREADLALVGNFGFLVCMRGVVIRVVVLGIRLRERTCCCALLHKLFVFCSQIDRGSEWIVFIFW
jgi:hypothetical protein